MRIDKFMNITNITKCRRIAQDMIAHNVVKINGATIKASHNIKIGDIIEIAYLEQPKFFKVLKIPEKKSIPKALKHEYITPISES